ncbi:hypothetical protein [Streptomyces sp. DW26H14]|uniref:hypothetical protein n=1 Tax=Streptomyces sp. DW26H14 TaxID=3435395 RepID=UPI00403DCFB8
MERNGDTFNGMTGGHVSGPFVQARDIQGDVNVAPGQEAYREAVAAALRQVEREKREALRARRARAERAKLEESRFLLGLLLFAFALAGLGALIDARRLVLVGGLVALGVVFLASDMGRKRR